MSTMTQTATTQVYRVHIRATPQAVWDAITDPNWTERYGYASRVDYDLRPGGAYKAYSNEGMKEAGRQGGFPVPDIAVDGEVIECNPPHKLVQTWRMLLDPESASEGFTKVTHEIKEISPGVTRLTLVHELDGAPKLAVLVGGAREEEGAGGGWAWVLSDLKTVLETGKSLNGR
jgi:uncharacterized protein YndB with AHSA1/START domain